MYNTFMLVGRLTEEPIIEGDTCKIIIGAKRLDGKTIDKIPCIIKGGMVDNVKEYCHKDTLVGIKGMILEGIELVADEITLLSSKGENNE